MILREPVTITWRKRRQHGNQKLDPGTPMQLRQKKTFAMVTDGSPV